MSERKVLNKYYPPDFDPSKIPRAKCPKNRQFTVRLMAPCNMKCFTCGEYIAKAKKFNARKEDVENIDYLGVKIYRFYIKCPGCLSEISFRTDPETTDYVIEAGAHRNFQALKLAEEQAEREEREKREEIESNPMLLLENRTQQSQYEMEVLESLEDLRELNERHARVDLASITEKFESDRKMTKELQEEFERLAALKALGYEVIDGKLIKRLFPGVKDEKTKKKFKFEEKAVSAEKKQPSGLKARLSNLIKISSKKCSSQVDLPPSNVESVSTKVINKISEGNDCQGDSKKSYKVTDCASENRGSPGCSENNLNSALSFLGAYSDSDDSVNEEN